MTRTNPTNLEEHLTKLVRAQKADNRVTIRSIQGKHIEAKTNMNTGEIEYSIPHDWDPQKHSKLARFARKQGIRNPKLKILEDTALHEVGHHRLRNDTDGLGCPEDLKGMEKSYEAVHKAMVEAGGFSNIGLQYLTNCIADIIDNTNVSNYSKMDGLGMFWIEQGELSQKFPALYEAFVKLNMH